MFRGAMISLLYSRSMNIQAGICSESAALTLMSTGKKLMDFTYIFLIHLIQPLEDY